jgi:arginyl-tRNA synthetase
MPPRRALGDLAVPLAFELARRLRKAPRIIAQEIRRRPGADRGDLPSRGRAQRLRQFLSRAPRRLRRWLPPRPAYPAAGRDKSIVEHTAINPNKAAHIGHLRNAALGDAFGRLLRFLGRDVEIQNYIDDTGVQVADVAVGFRELEHKTLDEVRALADTTRFDFYCWDLYARVTEWYEADKERLKIRGRALHDIEHGGNERRHGRLHRRPHRPLPPEDDGADEHRVRPADLGGRHPAAAFLGARVRVPEEDRCRLPADRGQAQGLLGDEDR